MYRDGPRFTPLFDLPVCSAGVVDFATSNKKSGAVQFESETLRTAVASVRFHYSTFDSALFLSSMLWWQRWGGGVGDVVELLFFQPLLPLPLTPHSQPQRMDTREARRTRRESKIVILKSAIWMYKCMRAVPAEAIGIPQRKSLTLSEADDC